jgi:hypothetical protein
MPDFNIRSDSVNVEQIMEQIRARIREKRGVDYTEQQIHDLAAVKLERFLDPSGVRSDLLEQFRKAQPAYEPPELPNFAFEESTLFESHRAPIRWMRKLLGPLLKLLFNPNPLIQALNIQSRLNTMNAEREAKREAGRRAMDQLYYELIHNLVVETTRMGIEVKNLKMRLESVSSRLEFNERRARALESAVVYRPSTEDVAVQRAPAAAVPQQQRQPQREDRQPHREERQPKQREDQRATPPPPAAPAPSVTAQAGTGQPSTGAGPSTGSSEGMPAEGPGQRSRKRRRRRGRRGGGSAASIMGAPGAGGPVAPGTGTGPTDALPDADEDTESDSDTSAEPANEAGPAAETSADPHTHEAVPDAPTTAAPRVEAAPAAEMSAEPRSDAAPDAHPPAMTSDTHTGAGENIERSGKSPSTGSGPGGSDPDTQ